jgi:hypothetical protein
MNPSGVGCAGAVSWIAYGFFVYELFIIFLPSVLLNTRLVHNMFASEQQSSKMWHRLSQ